MTKSEAEQNALEKNMNRKNIFCPLINDMCRIDCEAYIKAYADDKINNFNKGDYSVWDGYCVANALTTDRDYENIRR